MEGESYLLSLTSIVFAAVFVLSGCGSQFIMVRVAYDSQKYYGSSFTNVKNINLYVEKFSDVRSGIEQNVIGEARTGMFNQKTTIKVEGDIEEISTEAVRKAFSEAGFNVVMNEKNADLVFKGRINNFWVQEFVTGYRPEHTVADVEFDVVIIDKLNNKNIWYNVIKSYIKSNSLLDATYVNEKIIGETFNKVVISILNNDELATAINGFIQLKEEGRYEK